MITDSITERRDDHQFDHGKYVKNTDSSARKGNLGDKEEHGDTITIKPPYHSCTGDYNDLRAAVEELRLSQRADQYESQGEGSDYDYANDYE